MKGMLQNPVLAHSLWSGAAYGCVRSLEGRGAKCTFTDLWRLKPGMLTSLPSLVTTLQELTALQGQGGHAAEAYARPAPAHVVLPEGLSGLGLVSEQK